MDVLEKRGRKKAMYFHCGFLSVFPPSHSQLQRSKIDQHCPVSGDESCKEEPRLPAAGMGDDDGFID